MPVLNVLSPGVTIPDNGLPGFYDESAQTIDTDAVSTSWNAVLLAAKELETIEPAPVLGEKGGLVGTWSPGNDTLLFEENPLVPTFTVDAGWNVIDGQWRGSVINVGGTPPYTARSTNTVSGDAFLELRFRKSIGVFAGTFEIKVDNVSVYTLDLSDVDSGGRKIVQVDLTNGSRQIDLITTVAAADPAGGAIILDYFRIKDRSTRVAPSSSLITNALQELLVTKAGNWWDRTFTPGQRLVALTASPDVNNESDWFVSPWLDVDTVLQAGNETSRTLQFVFTTSGPALRSNDGTQRFLFLDDLGGLNLSDPTG